MSNAVEDLKRMVEESTKEAQRVLKKIQDSGARPIPKAAQPATAKAS